MQQAYKKAIAAFAITLSASSASMLFAASSTQHTKPQGQLSSPDFLPPPMPALGSRCDGASFEHGHGHRARSFTGTVMGRYAKKKKMPVEGVRFFAFWSLDPELAFTTNAKGRFQGDLFMHFEHWKKCVDGMVVGGSSVSDVQVTLRSKGCRELEVTFAAESPNLAIELDCTKSVP